MVICKHCESLLPPYYILCPVCGIELNLTYKIKLIDPPLTKEEQEIEENISTLVTFEKFTDTSELE